MAYNISRTSCRRNADVLKKMKEARATFSIKVRNPVQKAARIREALIAVRAFDDYNALYGHLKDCYKVRIGKDRQEVILEWIGEEGMVIGKSNKPMDYEITTSKLALEKTTIEKDGIIVDVSNTRAVVNDVLTIYEVISAAIKLSNEQEILFADTNLPNEDKPRLLKWATAKGWKYIDHEGAGLTLTKKEVDPLLLWEER